MYRCITYIGGPVVVFLAEETRNVDLAERREDRKIVEARASRTRAGFNTAIPSSPRGS